MKAKLLHYKIINSLHETGDDLTSLYLYIEVDNHKKLNLPIIVSYSELYDNMKTKNEAVYLYLQKIRSNIHGYGPKHSKIFEVLEAENFDLNILINVYFEEIDETFIMQHIEWCERISSQANQEAAAGFIKKINELVDDDYISYNIRLDEFRDAIDQKIHEVTLSYFPDLFEKEQAIINKYKSELMNITLRFSSTIDKLMHGIL